MVYIKKYLSPLGYIYINSDGEYLTAVCFEDTKDFNKYIKFGEEKDLNIFDEASRWLDMYFSSNIPDFTPKYKMYNITPFRNEVINEILKIPYGHTTTYSEISKKIAEKKGLLKNTYNRAVGNAVGWNPISIIIPCHRVIGSNGSLTGYGGGIKNKIKLLKLEQNVISGI